MAHQGIDELESGAGRYQRTARQTEFIGVRMPNVVYKEMVAKADSRGMGISEYVRALIRKDLDSQP